MIINETIKDDSINVFNDNKFNGVKNKYFVVSKALKSLNIKISGRNLRKIIYKYNKSGRVDDKRRICHKQRLITNRRIEVIEVYCLLINIFK